MASDQLYCISLDDDPLIHKIIGGITKLTTLPFVSASKLLERADSYSPVVAFLDIYLGRDESGLQILPDLRRLWPSTPLIVMTGHTDTSLIGKALSLGAHDFLRKPLVADELNARMQARCFEVGERQQWEKFTFVDITCERSQRTVEGPAGKRFLSPGEWELLYLLVCAAGQTIPKDQIKGKLWGELKVSDNAMDRKLSTLRRALREVGAGVTISTQYGKGVVLMATPLQQGA